MFVEGRYFLSSEGTNLELEVFDAFRNAFKQNIGNIAIGDGWLVSRYSTTQLLISDGQAWFDGLPYDLKSSRDNQVTLGIAPVGVTLTDEPTGLGKLITFSTGTTPTTDFRIVITAREQIITSLQDPFLQDVTVPEPTEDKIRLFYTIDIVTVANQGVVAPYDQSSPIPYVGESGASNAANLSNTILITPSSTSAYLISSVDVTAATAIDGRKVELTLSNPSGVNPFPIGSVDQGQFENGTFYDCYGNDFHINAIFNGTVSGQVIIRLDSEIGSDDPIIPDSTGFSAVAGRSIGFLPYSIVKQDVYYTDDTTGVPTGTLHWHVANANWSTTSGFVHSSVVTDLRTNIVSDEEFQAIVSAKFDLVLTGGGVISNAIDGETLSWSLPFVIINPSGAANTIRTGSQVILDGGSLVYTLNLLTGGNIDLGIQAVTVSSNTGTTAHLSGSPSLTSVRIGNVLVLGSQSVYITAIDDVNKTLTVSVALTTTGSATIYLDSFGPGQAPNNELTYTLAVANAGITVVGGILELSAGHTNAIYDERILYPSGLSASTSITLPINSRNFNNPQFYSPANGELQVYVNQLYKLQQTSVNPAADWVSIDDNHIAFNYALPNDSEVHFRIDSLPAGSLGSAGGGGGGGTLQGAYNGGNTITTTSGVPFTVSGPPGKIAVFNGDIDVTGIVDPSAVQLTPQSSNPLSGGQFGIWTNTAGELIYEGTTEINLSQATAGLPSLVAMVTSGQAFTANTSYLVRWGIPANSETADRIYVANAATASSNNYQVIGVLASTTSVSPGSIVKILYSGSYTLASADTDFSTGEIGFPVYLSNDGSGSFTVTPSTTAGDAQVQVGLVQSATQVWVNLKTIGEVVPISQYDEIIYYPSGLVATTSILIPANTRNSSIQEIYSVAGGDLEVYVNDLFKLQQTTTNPAADWYSIDTSHIAFNFDLPNDAQVHFRKTPLASGVLAGAGGGGSGTLQEAYNIGSTITVTSGNPFTVNGSGSKVAVFTGDIEVTGVVDPTGVQLTPQASNPLAGGQAGIWVDTFGQLTHTDGTTTTNISAVITEVQNGTAQTTISNTYTNSTGFMIGAFVPVYAPTSGHIDLADGTTTNKYQIIGITQTSIANSTTGAVAYSGYLTGVGGLTHGVYVYLGLTPGTLTSTPPSIGGGYPSGFNVIKLGTMDGTNLILQIQHIGTL